MNREDHFIGSRRIVERRLLVSEPYQFTFPVPDADVSTQIYQLLIDCSLEGIRISPV